MRFSDIEDSSGAKHTWDSNIGRWELGAGYRIDRTILAKVVYPAHEHGRARHRAVSRRGAAQRRVL